MAGPAAGAEAGEIVPGVRALDHTGDVGIVVEAPTLPEVFRRAAAGMLALLHGEDAACGGAEGDGEVRVVEVEAPEPGDLLVRWLREVLYLAQVKGLEPVEVEFERLELHGAPSLRARLRCRRTGRERRFELKAVTYHALLLASVDGGWRARVVFDV